MRVFAAIVLALVLAGTAAADGFPNRPVRVIVAFPAGGGTDIVARVVAQKLAEAWGQQVVVDNRGGAAGVIGTELAAGAPPDGHTLLVGTMGNLAVNPHLYPSMRVDPLRDFAPVTQLVNVSFAAMAYPGFPPNTMREVIALAEAHPGEVTYSSSGAGGAPHLAGSLLTSMTHIKLVHVPYKGSAPSFQDLLSGQVSMTFDSMVQGLAYIRDGRLKALAVLGPTRSELLPEVPTVAESGVPGYELVNWFGLVAPAATPRALIEKIAADTVGVLRQPETRDKLAAMGAEAVGNTPAEFAAVLRADTAKWGHVVKEANIRAE